MRATVVIGALMWALAGLGCATAVPAPEPPVPAAAQDAASLLAFAHASYRPFGPEEAVRRSLDAAERTLELAPENELAAFFAARAALWLLDFGTETDLGARKDLAERGLTHARIARAAGGERAEYVFLCGALLGYVIKESAIPNPLRLPEVKADFEKAAQLDPTYDQGAPLRALGTLLVLAPGWPAGPGDVDEGLRHLTAAVEAFPRHPANRFFLAQGLRADGSTAEAEAEYREVLALCRDAHWGTVCDRYGRDAERALDELGSGR